MTDRETVGLETLVFFCILACVKLDLFATVPLPVPPANVCTDTHTFSHSHTHTHTRAPAHIHTDFASMLQLPLVAQQGTVKLRSLPFLYCAALSCRISLLTQSCHGLQGLKKATERSTKWNSGNKPLIYFCTCMLMSAYLCARLCGWKHSRVFGNVCINAFRRFMVLQRKAVPQFCYDDVSAAICPRLKKHLGCLFV